MAIRRPQDEHTDQQAQQAQPTNIKEKCQNQTAPKRQRSIDARLSGMS